MSTVYIFGAGASKHAGYPLASEMGSLLLNWMQSAEDATGQFRPTARLIEERFGASPNIEDVITAISSEIERLRSDSEQEKLERETLGNARGWISAAVREWFRQIHVNPAPAYARFAERVRPGDVVISFNYDDSCERELKTAGRWELSSGYGFPLGSDHKTSPVRMLKLHGSVNWLISLFGGATRGPIAVGPNLSMGGLPVIHKADAEYLGYSDFAGNLYPGGGSLPCMIMPGRKKEFFYDTSFGREFGEFWDSLWSQAGEALSRAQRLVLIGYSLLPVDERACELILNTPTKSLPVIVISGSQSERIARDCRNAGFSDVVFRSARFEEWLAAENSQWRKDAAS